MTTALMVDDTVVTYDLMARVIREDLGWEVTTLGAPEAAIRQAEAGARYDVAIIDLSFPASELNGLDVLISLHEHDPSCRLIVYTDGDQQVAELMRDAWEALPLATMLSKSTPLEVFLRRLRSVAEAGTAPIDPVVQPLLPAERSQWRSLEGYGRLVAHAGHAKLWRALIDLDEEPSYQQIADYTGLKRDTVRNYRSELLEELSLHYLEQPKMRQMQRFAKRCRPLLDPYIRRRLSGEVADRP